MAGRGRSACLRICWKPVSPADGDGPHLMITAALPRSRLHLQFLVDNGADPDIVLFRDEMMRAPLAEAFPGRCVYLGREVVAGKALWKWPGVYRANQAYYRQLRAHIAELGITRLILFLEGEPLERYLCSLPQITQLELWEDGLSHYVDLTSDHWYAARGLVQAAMGFYPAGITRRRMDRSRALVRDRFEHNNLRLAALAQPPAFRDELLLVGSPLVEDRIVSQARFQASLSAIRDAVSMGIRYLPHPREDLTRLAHDLADDLAGPASCWNPMTAACSIMRPAGAIAAMRRRFPLACWTWGAMIAASSCPACSGSTGWTGRCGNGRPCLCRWSGTRPRYGRLSINCLRWADTPDPQWPWPRGSWHGRRSSRFPGPPSAN